MKEFEVIRIYEARMDRTRRLLFLSGRQEHARLVTEQYLPSFWRFPNFLDIQPCYGKIANKARFKGSWFWVQGLWPPATGHWFLAAGCWTLVIAS